MRGVVDDADLISLSGTAVRRAAWAIGASFAAISGILIAPTLGLDAVLLAQVVVQAFGAAAVGRFTSIPSTFAGGRGRRDLSGSSNGWRRRERRCSSSSST